MIENPFQNPNTDTLPFTFSNPLHHRLPHPILTDKPLSSTEAPYPFVQLNCHLSKEITLTLLSHQHNNLILLLQEPWVNLHTLLPPTHPNWHMFAGFEHQPRNWRDQHKCCIYVHKSIPSKAILQILNNSKHLISLQVLDTTGCKETLVNLYNPPRTNEGLKDLACWLGLHNDRQSPICLFMDSNLRHRMWNPMGHYSSHREAAELISLCGASGFRLASPRHVPTFYSAKGRGTTIDLIWSNFKALKLLANVKILEDNFGSDHQALTGILSLKGHIYTHRWAKPNWNKLDQKTVCENFNRLSNSTPMNDDVNISAILLTNALQSTQLDLGKYVQHNDTRSKRWWDPEILNPILQTRSRARQWMIRSNTEEARQCYREWNDYFRHVV